MQTTLTRSQEIIVMQLRISLLLTLDDLTAIVKEYTNPDASRSGIARLCWYAKAFLGWKT
jgi:hypothetical protein